MWRFSISASDWSDGDVVADRFSQRQVFRPDGRRLAHDHGPFDGVGQLADVARPVVGREQFHRLGADAGDAFVHLAGESFEEVVAPAPGCRTGARAAAASRW